MVAGNLALMSLAMAPLVSVPRTDTAVRGGMRTYSFHKLHNDRQKMRVRESSEMVARKKDCLSRRAGCSISLWDPEDQVIVR